METKQFYNHFNTQSFWQYYKFISFFYQHFGNHWKKFDKKTDFQ